MSESSLGVDLKLFKRKKGLFADLSFWILVLSNCLTIGVAVAKNWPLLTLLIVYWVQSVIIGFFNYWRIVTLKEFSTEGFYLNDKPVSPTEKTKRSAANFFALHYGFFHAIYAVFLFSYAGDVNVTYVLWGGCIFFLDHLFSFKYNREKDEKKKRNIGSLMFLPYVRIVPMHIIILFCGVLLSGKAPLIMFLGLKTVADAVMHIVEHEML